LNIRPVKDDKNATGCLSDNLTVNNTSDLVKMEEGDVDNIPLSDFIEDDMGHFDE
jgi:hypothetical protein